MKTKYLVLFTFILSLFVTALAFAQISADPTQPVSDADFLTALFASFQSLKGMGGLAIAGVATQLLMYLFRTPLLASAGKWKLTAVYLFSLASGAIALKLGGGTWASVALNTQVLAGMQVFLHQVYDQFFGASSVADAATAAKS